MRKLDQIINSTAFQDAYDDAYTTYLCHETIELLFDDRIAARKHQRNLNEAGLSTTSIEVTTLPGDYSTTAYVFHIIA